ncbi:ABC transporter permease YtrF precursor [bacterium BMS3Bbin04]|nr:ABC transporter permease YtrF precursor [bacterium BMS3Bbin04]
MRTTLIAMRLAIRNLRRHKRRTTLTVTGLTLGLIVMIVAYAMLDGLTDQGLDSFVLYETAHLRGYPPGYLDDDIYRSLDRLFDNADSLSQSIADELGVQTTVRLNIPGQLIVGREEAFVEIVGVDPIRDRDVFATLDKISDGEGFGAVEGMLIGRKLAKDMGLAVGDRATIFARSAPGAYNSRRLPVIGILSTGNPKVDGMSVYLTLTDAQQLALVENAANELAVLSGRRKDTDRLRETLLENGSDLEWQTWEEAAGGFLFMMQFRRITFGVIVLILAMIAAVAVSNTMIMAVHERTREIGALRAMGFERSMIGHLFLFEGISIGLISGFAAIIIGGLVVLWLNNVGISIAAYDDIQTGLPISTAFYPSLHLANLVSALIFGLALTALASLAAVNRAQRGEVVRALREGQL